MQVADLDILITVPDKPYVPGKGFIGWPEQTNADRLPIYYKWGDDPKAKGLVHVPYDVELSFSEETLKQLPNLFYLFNGLPETDEVTIPDTGYESRDFIIVNRTIVVKGLMVCDRRMVERQLEYILRVLTEKTIVIASRRDTTCLFSEEDAKLLANVVDGNSAKKNAGPLRQLAERIRLFVTKGNQ